MINGSPEDRGSADRYYGRSYKPHYYPNGTYKGPRVTDLTPTQHAEYKRGWDNETNRKDWGNADAD